MSDRFELKVWAGIALLCGVVLFLTLRDQRQWDAYAAAHHCQEVDVQPGTAIDVGDSNEPVSLHVDSGQHVFHCDAGEVQIR